MKRFFIFLLLACSCMILSAEEAIKAFSISNQEQFESLNTNLRRALRQGAKELTVNIQPGIYYYNEKHLSFSSQNYPDASVTIIGDNAILVAKDLGQEASWQDGLFDEHNRQNADGWTPLTQSTSDVDVVDVETKLCRIRTPKRQSAQNEAQCAGQFLQLTQWYKSQVYPIVRRTSHYIYFTATDLEYSQTYGHWNVNYDMYYGHVNPRYRTISTSANQKTGRTRCQASTFLNLWHSQLGTFTLKGIEFGPNNGKSPLIDTDMFSSNQLRIEDCKFCGIRGLVVKVWYTNNVLICNNTFDECYDNGIESFNASRNTQIINNVFRNHGLGMRNTFCVICRGEDFLVQGNTFRNFNYAAIGAGLWYGNKQNGAITGKILENDIAYEPAYYDDYARHTLMDGGAIYTWTICDDVVIKGNRIDNFRGMHHYRGIFCDDGAKNLTVTGNTITNIGEDCWCIDLRWVENVSEKVPDHNTGNVVSGNQVDGRIRFETKKP